MPHEFLSAQQIFLASLILWITTLLSWFTFNTFTGVGFSRQVFQGKSYDNIWYTQPAQHRDADKVSD